MRRSMVVTIAVFVTSLSIYLSRLQAAPPAPQRTLTAAETEELTLALKLNDEAVDLFRAGKMRESVAPAGKSLGIRRRILGDSHTITITTARNLGQILHEQGAFADSLRVFEFALNGARQGFGEHHEEAVKIRNDVGTTLLRLGRHEAAHEQFKICLESIRTRPTADPNEQAPILVNLGVTARQQGEFAMARNYYEQSLALLTKSKGDENVQVAYASLNLGALLQAMGDYGGARVQLEKALNLFRKLRGDEHSETAAPLNNLGSLLLAIGDYATAEKLFVQSLEIKRRALGAEHPDTVLTLSNIATLLQQAGKPAAALRFHEEGARTRKKVLPANHPEIVESLNNLGACLCDLKRFDEAAAVLTEASDMLRASGKNSAVHGSLLNNLGGVYEHLGQTEKARDTFVLATDVHRAVLGASHPNFLLAMSNLARMSDKFGDRESAWKYFDEARRGVRQHVARVLPSLSELEQEKFLRQQYNSDLHTALSFALSHRAEREKSSRSAAWLANGKAVAHEALAARNLTLRDLRDAKLAPVVQNLLATRRRLAALSLATPNPEQAQERQAFVAKLTAEEAALTRQLSDVAVADDAWIPWEKVRSAIPPQGVLVDIARFQVFDTHAKEGTNGWQPARYAAWISQASGQTTIVDLGDAAAMDAVITETRAALLKSVAKDGALQQEGELAAVEQLAPALRKLAELVWFPVAREIGEARELILSPDGALWLTPWGALPATTDGKEFLIEKYSVRLLTSGRDLCRAEEATSKQPPIIFANPLFNQPAAEKRTSIQAIFPRLSTPDDAALRGLTVKNILPPVEPLPGTAMEAAAVRPNLEKYCSNPAVMYEGQYALESVAKKLNRPKAILAATHGFFLPTDGAVPDVTPKADTKSTFVNPLLRCGVLLAGCNQRGDAVADDDGVLTGLEVTGIDLRGTDLVVLSACETGLGDVRDGEGVAGLRQAFQLAGARSIVSSLWQVPDKDSALIMNELFAELAGGRAKSEALRAAQLKRIEARRNRNGAAHPFFWAAWTITGM